MQCCLTFSPGVGGTPNSALIGDICQGERHFLRFPVPTVHLLCVQGVRSHHSPGCRLRIELSWDSLLFCRWIEPFPGCGERQRKTSISFQSFNPKGRGFCYLFCVFCRCLWCRCLLVSRTLQSPVWDTWEIRLEPRKFTTLLLLKCYLF